MRLPTGYNYKSASSAIRYRWRIRHRTERQPTDIMAVSKETYRTYADAIAAGEAARESQGGMPPGTYFVDAISY